MARINTYRHQFPTWEKGEDPGAGQQPMLPNRDNQTDVPGINGFIQKLDELLKYITPLDIDSPKNSGKLMSGGIEGFSLPNDLVDNETIIFSDGIYSVGRINGDDHIVPLSLQDDNFSMDVKGRLFHISFGDQFTGEHQNSELFLLKDGVRMKSGFGLPIIRRSEIVSIDIRGYINTGEYINRSHQLGHGGEIFQLEPADYISFSVRRVPSFFGQYSNLIYYRNGTRVVNLFHLEPVPITTLKRLIVSITLRNL